MGVELDFKWLIKYDFVSVAKQMLVCVTVIIKYFVQFKYYV